MGYTNYWHHNKSFTNNEWKLIKDEYEYIKEMCEGIIIDESEKNCDEIVFNGKGDLSHETFILCKTPRTKETYKGEDITFNFCKTARKPYDIAVWHMLFFTKNKTNGLSKISRDW
jgi:hypothetical protein